MPLYEYQCENCGELFEVMQKFSDEPLTTHAKCGGNVHRLISAPALQFKGSGWYVTDYAKGSSSSGNGPGKSAEPSSSSGTSGEKSGTTSSSTGSADKPSGSSSGKKSE